MQIINEEIFERVMKIENKGMEEVSSKDVWEYVINGDYAHKFLKIYLEEIEEEGK